MGYKKFTLKNAILRCLSEGEMTGREIRTRVGYPSNQYRNWNSELYVLKKRGYLKTKKDSNPMLFSLTSKGKRHHENPYIWLEKKRSKKQIIYQNDISNESGDSHTSGGSYVSGGSGVGNNADNTHLLEELSEKDSQIMRLQEVIRTLSEEKYETKQQLHKITNPGPIDPMKEKMLNDRKKARYSIAQKWSRRYLTYEFFREWTSEFPYMMRGHKKLKRNCVEILGRNNPEIARGHVDHALRPQEIAAAQFRITEIKGNGLLIESEALAGGKKLLVW
jgi:predicted transcriptional regulator